MSLISSLNVHKLSDIIFRFSQGLGHKFLFGLDLGLGLSNSAV